MLDFTFFCLLILKKEDSFIGTEDVSSLASVVTEEECFLLFAILNFFLNFYNWYNRIKMIITIIIIIIVVIKASEYNNNNSIYNIYMCVYIINVRAKKIIISIFEWVK